MRYTDFTDLTDASRTDFSVRFRTEKQHLYKLIGAGSHRTDKIELNAKLIRGEATCHDSLFDFCTFHQSYLA